MSQADRQLAAEALWLLEHPEELARRRVRFRGLPELDASLAPMLGELVLIGAENGSGKTVFVDTLCRDAALTGKRSLRFVLEDSKIETRFRVLSAYVGIPASLLKNGEVDLAMVKQRLEDAPAVDMQWVEHEHRLAAIVQQVEAEASTLDIVTIDYLQVLEGFQSQDRRNQVRLMIQALQDVARTHNILLIVVSQLVRPESRKVGEKPTRHWLKEASDIADAADKIVLLWREQSDGHHPTHCLIDKDKGGTGTGRKWDLDFDMARSRFVEARRG